MKACLKSFRAGIKELLSFLSNTEHEDELIGLLLRPGRIVQLEEQERLLLTHMSAARTDSKRYIYCVAIVSLYGLLERLVDSMIEAFVGRVASLAGTYEKMPEAIKKNHVPMSVDLVKALMEDRYRECTTQEEVIANLHACLSGAANFRVNGSAFVLHRGNITIAKITQFLTSVGIDLHNRRVARSRELCNFFSQREPKRDIGALPDQEIPAILEPIEDLVQRRNQVSHGVIDDIESPDLLKERCRFVEAYGAGLYDVLLQEVLKYLIKLPPALSLGKPIAVYNHSIVCFEINNCRVALGDVLAAATGDRIEPFRFSLINSLQVDHQSLTEVVATKPTQFGAQVSFQANPHHDYYILPDGVI